MSRYDSASAVSRTVERALPVVSLRVNERRCRALMDTGCTDTLISRSHGWRIVETRGGAFPLAAVQFEPERSTAAVLPR